MSEQVHVLHYFCYLSTFPNFAQIGQKGSKNGVFQKYLKIWSLFFAHFVTEGRPNGTTSDGTSPMSGKKSGSLVFGLEALDQSDCRILQMFITGEPFDIYFWNFVWSQKSIKVNKWVSQIFGENSRFAKIGQKCPKNGPFVYISNSCD